MGVFSKMKSGLGLVIVATLALQAGATAAEPPKLIAAFFVKGKVGLKWQKLDGISEYGVYRKGPEDDGFGVISTTDDDHYFDLDVSSGAVYVYKIGITAPDGSSVFSKEKSVTIPGAAAGEFIPPEWVGLRIEQDNIFLNWDPVPGAIAYNIHRSETADGEYEIVGNVQTSKYADKSGLERGRIYYYKLSALNGDFEETDLTEELSIKFGFSLEEQQALESEEKKIELEEVKLTQLVEITDAGPHGPMNQPADVFVNSQGNIYVTDALNSRVHCFAGTGKYLFSFGEKMDPAESADPPPGAFQTPFTLFIDQQDQVYVTDVVQNDIQVFAADGKFIKRIRVDVGEGNNPLRANGIHVLDDGRIVITDTGNHRFLVIDGNGKILLSKGNRGRGDGEFSFPDELTVTPDNKICVVDVINCRIQIFDLDGNFIRTFGEVGQTAGTFARPKAITVDGQGRLWVSDGMSGVIQSFTMEGEVKSAIGTMQDESIKFQAPRGIFFQGDRFYVVNRLANQVVVYKIG